MPITDEESLRKWLADRPREDVLCIAMRSAQRVFPLWSSQMDRPWARQRNLTALPVLFLNLAATVALKYQTPEAREAAAVADSHAASSTNDAGNIAFDIAISLTKEANDPSFANRTDLPAIRNEFAALSIATFAASYAYLTAGYAAGYAGGVHVSSSAPYSYAQLVFAKDIWPELDLDAQLLDRSRDLASTRLWSATPPDWFTRADTETRAIWAADPPGRWDFWLRWWDGILAGKPLDWDLQRDVALIPDADWQQGPDHIARLIARIELDHAIAATPNGETIEINPESGRLRIVPVTDLPADIATYARRKILKAVDLFGETPGNQYAALRDDLRLLRDAVDDPDNTPVELFDACASASRRLTQRIRNAECPTGEQDPVIADYATRIREAGADILGNDPKTQEMLTARNAITGNNALIEGGAVIRAASDLIAPGTEGLLAKALPRDAAVASDPNADPEDRKTASFRTASRLLRIGKVIATPVAWAGGTTIGVAAVIQAVPVILRFLGF